MPQLNARASKANAETYLDKETSCINVRCKTDETQRTSKITVFLFKDSYKGQLLATVRLEV